MYGQHVEVLILGATMIHALQLSLFWQPAATLSRLKRLEVVQKHSLVMLAPVLGQLPQLQHLTAHVSMASDVQHAEVTLQGEVEGVFIDESGAAWDPPDLQQLCPHLIHLHLTVVPDRPWPLWVDARLPWLLPAPLQQLTLASWQHACMVSAASLVHLTSLQQLTLAKMDVPEPGPGELAEALVSLQQLRVVDPVFLTNLRPAEPARESLLQLAPLITAYHCSRDTLYRHVCLVPALNQLTSLMLFSENCPQGMDRAIAALPHLQELGIRGYLGGSAEAALRQAGNMEQLRSLHLEGFALSPGALVTSLGHCTQLTSLVFLVKVSAQSSTACCFVEPPSHQLQALQRLVIHKHLLVFYEGDWLAPLARLSTLEVILPSSVRELFGWGIPHSCPCNANQWCPLEDHPIMLRKLLRKVGEWPPSLQSVVLWVHWMAGQSKCKTRSWAFTPPGAGSSSSSSRKVTVWYEQRRGTAERWARPLRPCPHLPGVWELQGEVEGSNWQALYW
jgi:hypothetical protein